MPRPPRTPSIARRQRKLIGDAPAERDPALATATRDAILAAILTEEAMQETSAGSAEIGPQVAPWP